MTTITDQLADALRLTAEQLRQWTRDHGQDIGTNEAQRAASDALATYESMKSEHVARVQQQEVCRLIGIESGPLAYYKAVADNKDKI